jgi:hypothetical protein
MSRPDLAGAKRNPTNIGRHRLLVMQRSKQRVQMHSSPNRERYLSFCRRSKLIAAVATVSSGKAPVR